MKTLILAIFMLITTSTGYAATFEVHNTGTVDGYFLGATAGFTNRATLNFEDGMPSEVKNAWLYNTDPVVTKFSFGIHEKGSQVVLVNHTVNTNDWWYSEKSFNNDNQIHMKWDQIYLANGMPAIIVRWEDLYGGGDLDFNDNVLLFTNIVAIPEPPMVILLLLGLFLVPLIKRNSKDGFLIYT